MEEKNKFSEYLKGGKEIDFTVTFDPPEPEVAISIKLTEEQAQSIREQLAAQPHWREVPDAEALFGEEQRQYEKARQEFASRGPDEARVAEAAGDFEEFKRRERGK